MAPKFMLLDLATSMFVVEHGQGMAPRLRCRTLDLFLQVVCGMTNTAHSIQTISYVDVYETETDGPLYQIGDNCQIGSLWTYRTDPLGPRAGFSAKHWDHDRGYNSSGGAGFFQTRAVAAETIRLTMGVFFRIMEVERCDQVFEIERANIDVRSVAAT